MEHAAFSHAHIIYGAAFRTGRANGVLCFLPTFLGAKLCYWHAWGHARVRIVLCSLGREGHPYLGITDNADEQERVLVYRVEAPEGKRLLCEVPLFSPGASANENAPVGIGDSVVVANTHGYDYNDYTGHAARPLSGGLTCIDVRSGRSSCDVVWTNPVSSAAVPKLSIADRNIYTVERTVTASTPLYHLNCNRLSYRPDRK